MNAGALLETLSELEVETHRPQVRSDQDRLGRLLHPGFFEAGRSGTLYSRDRVSVWQSTEQGWQLRFHQGTPVPAFEKHAS